MSNYTVWYTDFKTGELLGSVPALWLTASSELNGLERLSVGLPMQFDPAISAPVAIDTSSTHTLNNFNVGGTGVFIVRDDVILFGGLLWGISAVDFASETFQLDCAGMMSYLQRRYLHNTLTFSSVDQNSIASGLVDAAMSGVAVETVPNLHGVTRDRTYIGDDRHNVAEALDNLSQSDGGFDYYFTHALVGTAISSTMRTLYPATGRETSYLLDMENCSGLKLSIDGSNLVNYAYAASQGLADYRNAISVSNSAQTATLPALESVEFYHNLTEAETLQAKAQRTLARGAVPAFRASASLHPDAEPKLGSYLIGDRIRLRAKHGAVDIDKKMRIIANGLSVDSDGKEVQLLELASAELFV